MSNSYWENEKPATHLTDDEMKECFEFLLSAGDAVDKIQEYLCIINDKVCEAIASRDAVALYGWNYNRDQLLRFWYMHGHKLP